MLVRILLLLESGSLNALAELNGSQAPINVQPRYAESKRSCCAVRLLISRARFTYRGDFSQESGTNERKVGWKRHRELEVKVREQEKDDC